MMNERVRVEVVGGDVVLTVQDGVVRLSPAEVDDLVAALTGSTAYTAPPAGKAKGR